MSIHVEQLGALERRVFLAIPIAAVEAETQARIRSMAKRVRMDGFRPGKVPVRLVAQTYGAQVRFEVIGDHVERAFNQIVAEQKLRVAGTPRIEPRTDGVDSGHFGFTATFEVFPQIEFPSFEGVTIERPAVEITEADVDRTIEKLRAQRVRYEPKTEPAEDGDRVIVDFDGLIDGAPFSGSSGRDLSIILGQRRMLPEFEDNIRGLTAGARCEFAVTYPSDHFSRELAGKTVQFTVTVKAVYRPILPEVDAEFARAFGVASGEVATLRSEVRSNLELERKRRVFQAERDQVFKALRRLVEVPIPKSLVQAEAERMAQAASEELRRTGVPPPNAEVSPSTFEPAATERVAMGLIVSELVRAHQLEATPAQVRALVEEHAQSYENPEQVVAWHFQDPKRLAPFEARALEQNVVNYVLERAQVVDKPMTFLELIGRVATS
ncbi:MAG: trigger factor [Casimicrobiaceae bacterium]|nr:trigger factor [Casimicrobiaceae bacterium]MDW8311352.1 trigger factor [Burkholderiales bacterium]